jgi:hypothetical protein
MRTFSRFFFGTLAALLLAAALPAGAAITQTINYQGFLLSKLTNMPVDTGWAIKFLIYNTPSAGSQLFSEERCGVPVSKGRYDVEIGSMTAGGIPDTVFTGNPDLWLEIQVSPSGACGGAYEPMSPRIRLQASPYAFNSLYASSAAAAAPGFTADIISAQPQTTFGAVTISTNLFVQGGISVGSISPGQKLSVAGMLQITGDPLVNGLQFADGSIQYKAAANTMWDVNGNNVYSINTGNVGIGESLPNPRARLEVSTAAADTGDILILSTGTSVMFRVNGLGQVFGGSYYGSGATLTGVVDSTGAVMTGPLTLLNSSITVTSPSGLATPKVKFLPNVEISTTAGAYYGGLSVSTNVYVVGIASATWLAGDGSGIYNVATKDASKVLKAGDTMTGQLTLLNSTLTVTGSAFSVTGSTFSVFGGSVAIGGFAYPYMLTVGGGMLATSSITAQGGLFANSANFQALTASSASFSGFGAAPNNYTIDTASGIKVNAGIISAPYFVGDGSRLTNVALGAGGTVNANLIISGSSLTVASFGAQTYALTVASAAAVNAYSLAVTTAGYVGVQVQTPSAPLEVANKLLVSYGNGGTGTNASANIYANGGYAYLNWADYANTPFVALGALGYIPGLTHDFVFRELGTTPGNGGAEVFRINTAGSDTNSGSSWRFGIGTSSPAEKFHIATNMLVSTSDFVSPIMYISTTAGTVSISTRSHPNALTVNGGIMAVSSITAQGGFFGDASGLTNINTSGLPDQIAISSIAARATSTYGAVVFTSNTYVNADLAVGEVFTPATPLHVRGVVTIDQNETDGFTNLNFALHNGGPAYINWSEAGVGSKGSLGMPANFRDLIYKTGAADEVFRVKGNPSGGHGWQFGIGTPNPLAAFNVAADMLVSTAAASPILYVSTTQGAVGIWTNSPAERFNVASTMLVGSPAAPLIYASTATNFTGIGTASPRAMLEVGGGNLLAAGTWSGTPSLPVTGAGTRFMWIPSMAAIRAGTVSGTEWDTIGNYSAAFGEFNSVSGDASSVSGGYSNSVSGNWSVIAGGSSNNITNTYSSVLGGNTNHIDGTYSVVPGGRFNIVESGYAFAGGYNNYLDAGATGSFAWGYDDNAAHGHDIHNTFKITAPYVFLVDPADTHHYDVGVRTPSPQAALDVNGDAQFGAGANKSTFTASGYWMPVALTTPQLQSTAPDSAGEVVMNSSITDLCVSTGTAAGQWALVGSRGTGSCY